MSNKHADIMIIDDDPHFLEYLGIMLLRWGHKVRAYSDPAAALAQLRQQAPGLLITDMYMPEVDGVEVLWEAKRSQPQVPVICISGNSKFDILGAALVLGARATFKKPLDHKALRQAIETIVDR